MANPFGFSEQQIADLKMASNVLKFAPDNFEGFIGGMSGVWGEDRASFVRGQVENKKFKQAGLMDFLTAPAAPAPAAPPAPKPSPFGGFGGKAPELARGPSGGPQLEVNRGPYQYPKTPHNIESGWITWKSGGRWTEKNPFDSPMEARTGGILPKGLPSPRDVSRDFNLPVGQLPSRQAMIDRYTNAPAYSPPAQKLLTGDVNRMTKGGTLGPRDFPAASIMMDKLGEAGLKQGEINKQIGQYMDALAYHHERQGTIDDPMRRSATRATGGATASFPGKDMDVSGWKGMPPKEYEAYLASGPTLRSSPESLLVNKPIRAAVDPKREAGILRQLKKLREIKGEGPARTPIGFRTMERVTGWLEGRGVNLPKMQEGALFSGMPTGGGGRNAPVQSASMPTQARPSFLARGGEKIRSGLEAIDTKIARSKPMLSPKAKGRVKSLGLFAVGAVGALAASGISMAAQGMRHLGGGADSGAGLAMSYAVGSQGPATGAAIQAASIAGGALTAGGLGAMIGSKIAGKVGMVMGGAAGAAAGGLTGGLATIRARAAATHMGAGIVQQMSKWDTLSDMRGQDYLGSTGGPTPQGPMSFGGGTVTPARGGGGGYDMGVTGDLALGLSNLRRG